MVVGILLRRVFAGGQELAEKGEVVKTKAYFKFFDV